MKTTSCCRWQATPNLTLTFGLRYSLSEPPYEVNGQQVAPNIPMKDWFDQRVENMEAVKKNWAANIYSLETMTKNLGGKKTPAAMRANRKPTVPFTTAMPWFAP